MSGVARRSLFIIRSYDQRLVLSNISIAHITQAKIYNAAQLHDTWDRLPELQVPVWVVCGREEGGGVSGLARRVQQQIPRSHLVSWESCSHFGPMEMPSKLSDLVEEVVLELSLDRDL